MALNLQHQTAAEFALRFWSRVREAYATGDKVEYARLIWWLANKVAAGDITDAQARTSFNTAFGQSLTAAEWTTLKTNRLIPARNRYQALLDEAEL